LKHRIRYKWVTLASINWTSTSPHHHATPTQANHQVYLLQVSQDHASEGSTSRKSPCLSRQRLARPRLGRPNASEGHASEGQNKRRRQSKKGKRKTILLLMPRKTALTIARGDGELNSSTLPFVRCSPTHSLPTPRKNAWPPTRTSFVPLSLCTPPL
jgi:hypothetical protein